MSIVFWYDIFFQVNKASKLLQSSDAYLDAMASEINATRRFVVNYREKGHESADVDAREIAEKLGIERTFPEIRARRGRRMFQYEGQGDVVSAEQQHKRTFFETVDTAIESLANQV